MSPHRVAATYRPTCKHGVICRLNVFLQLAANACIDGVICRRNLSLPQCATTDATALIPLQTKSRRFVVVLTERGQARGFG